jgi:hypothetical protein
VAPIHFDVCTEPSGFISETKPSLGSSGGGLPAFRGLPAFIATIRLRSGSKVQLSAKWKLPNTFTLFDIFLISPASFVALSGVPAAKGFGCWLAAGACASAALPATRAARKTARTCLTFIYFSFE